ncbi:MAG TPA: laccase domain-containing protein [Candidatus Acidoferrum sp.]|nr:laccase domain-containing protein [Candidatus Acidoferrum sp.]
MIQKVTTSLTGDGYWTVEGLPAYVRLRIAGMQQGSHNFFVNDQEANKRVASWGGGKALDDLLLPDEKAPGIRVIKKADKGMLTGVSGLITHDTGKPLIMRSGDAPLVFAYAPGLVALAHMTTQDVLSGMPRRFVEQIAKEASLADVNFIVGPGIQACHYPYKWTVMFKLPGSVQFKGGKVLLDVPGAICRQLKRAGVRDAQITYIDECMYHSGKYFSQRRRNAEGDTKIQGNGGLIELLERH